MLAVKINNTWVDLFPNASMKYVFNSPAFSDNPIVGDFSYPISFPLTEPNKQTFDFVNLPDTFEDTIEYECELYDENIHLVTGVFKLTGTDGKISGNIINAAYSFINQIKNKTTKDLELGGDQDFGSPAALDTHFLNALSGSYPSYNFSFFPILNEILYKGTVVEIDWTYISYINKWNPKGDDYLLFPYLAYVIKQIFSTFNITIDSAIANDSELKKLVLTGVFKENMFGLVTTQAYNLLEHIIKYDLEELLKGINDTLCTATFFDNKSHKAEMVLKKDLLTADYVDWTDKVVSNENKDLTDEDSGNNLNYNFDSTDETISERQLIDGSLDDITISAPVLTPANLPIYGNMGTYAGEVRYVTCEDTFYVIRNFPDPNPNYLWTPLTWNYFSKIVGEGLKEKRSRLSTMGMNWHAKKTGNLKNNWMVPHSDQELFSDPEKGIKDMATPTPTYVNCLAAYVNEFEPRIMFYRGMQPDSADVTYPLGTSGKYDAKGNIVGSQTLNWDGDDGLYEKLWKEWLTFLEKSKPRKIPVLLDLVDILNLDLKKQVKIGPNFYLIKQLPINLPIKKAVIAELVRI